MRTALQFLFVAVDDLREGMEENKKSASPKKNCAYGSPDSIVCIKGGMSLPVVACHNRPSEAHCSGCGYLQAALQASPSLAWSCLQYAISDGRFASHRDCRGCPTGPTGDADAKRAISPTFVTHPGIARRGNEGLVLCPPRWRCSSLAYRFRRLRIAPIGA